MIWLALAFFAIATFYASAGFGGGSSYVALLALSNTPYLTIPIISLICNITVVSGSSIHYVRAGHLNWRLLLPTTAASIPMSYLGGRLLVAEKVFTVLLCISLFVVGIRMLINHQHYTDTHTNYRPLRIDIALLAGAILGFISGIVGIGGGIFLAPILYTLRAGSPKQIATTASLFILLNSIAGLFGQWQKNGFSEVLLSYWYLPVIVLLGGQLGNFITLKLISNHIVTLITATLVLIVASKLGHQILF